LLCVSHQVVETEFELENYRNLVNIKWTYFLAEPQLFLSTNCLFFNYTLSHYSIIAIFTLLSLCKLCGLLKSFKRKLWFHIIHFWKGIDNGKLGGGGHLITCNDTFSAPGWLGLFLVNDQIYCFVYICFLTDNFLPYSIVSAFT